MVDVNYPTTRVPNIVYVINQSSIWVGSCSWYALSEDLQMTLPHMHPNKPFQLDKPGFATQPPDVGMADQSPTRNHIRPKAWERDSSTQNLSIPQKDNGVIRFLGVLDQPSQKKCLMQVFFGGSYGFNLFPLVVRIGGFVP